MAIFVPRNPQQVLREMLGKVVNRTELSDVQVGSSLFTLLNAMAHEVANTEARMFNLRASFALENAEGEDLDARVSELPPIGISRKKSSNASGSVLKITRTAASAGKVALFPNPAKGSVNIQFSGFTSNDINVSVNQFRLT